jgi:hypothetical protein
VGAGKPRGNEDEEKIMNAQYESGWYDANSGEFLGKRIRGLRKADSLRAIQGIVIAPDGRRVYWAD